MRIAEIKRVIKEYRLVSDRETHLCEKGYLVAERPMGSGGVGQVVRLRGEIRIQIGHGHGRYNYAKAVILK